ncbi:MAG: type IV pilin [Candidatus Wukongarchaeota archaeon]|nr:type IV pilin [Candidatus Wukongarchaeota archaeon]
MFLSKISKLCKRRKRAVSPVVATVLLIAITVAAAAMVFFVVMPMIQGSAEPLVGTNNTAGDNNGDYLPETFYIEVGNTGTDDVKIDSVTIKWVNGTAEETATPTTALTTLEISGATVEAGDASDQVTVTVDPSGYGVTTGSSDGDILYRFTATVEFDDGTTETTDVFEWSPA